MVFSNVLRNAVIAVVLIIVIAIFIGKETLFAEEYTEVEICRQSVEIGHILRLSDIEFAEEVNCPTRYVEIEGDNSKVIKREIAERMADCWYQFGEGKYELFDTQRATTDAFCAVCNQINFEEKGERIDGFLEFLAQNNPGGKKFSYHTYLTGSQTTQDVINNVRARQAVDFIDTDSNYATVFVYAKQVGFWDRFSTGATLGTAGVITGIVVGGFLTAGATWIVGGATILGTVGFAGGALVGGDLDVEWQSGVFLVPYQTDELEKLECEILPVRQ